jgi:hypothetical protein
MATANSTVSSRKNDYPKLNSVQPTYYSNKKLDSKAKQFRFKWGVGCVVKKKKELLLL